jgi:biopolymer transport protein ExbD
LIDVLLVLLIMFVITIPMATHSVDIDVGTGEKCQDCPLNPIKNLVSISPQDAVAWNGMAVTQGQLARLLTQTRTMAIEPELQFEPHANAGYKISAETLATIKASGVTRFGFVGNERYRQFVGL